MNTEEHVRKYQVVTVNEDYADLTLEPIALFDADGNPFLPDGAAPQNGDDVVLVDYIPHAAGNISGADTVNVAIAKLEARIADLETP